MSESQMQPGWYYAQGDAPGTQRYWDGTQWVGGPQPVGQGSDVAAGGGLGQSVEFGPRATAWLIDVGPYWLAVIIGSFTDQTVNILIGLVALAYLLYNKGFKMGTSGQSFGKGSQGIKLVSENTGQPIGVGMAILRLFVSWLFLLPCLIPHILDHLWPLWDGDKKRLLDKIFSTKVVQA
ncbi:MAG: RDD family protein [Actinomycetota bacterium]